MTDKTVASDERGQATKMPGWFSWRHRTRDAHDEATATYLANHGRAARREKAAERPPAPHERTKAHRLGRCVCEAAA